MVRLSKISLVFQALCVHLCILLGYSHDHELCREKPQSASQERLEEMRDRNARELHGGRLLQADCQNFCQQCITVPVQVHLGVASVSEEGSGGFFVPHPAETYDQFRRGEAVTEEWSTIESIRELLTENFRIVNEEVYVDTPFFFEWSETLDTNVVVDSRMVSLDFTKRDEQTDVGQEIRVGGADFLNVFIGHEVCDFNSNGERDCNFLGAAYLPSQYRDNPFRDGVYVKYSTLYNGGNERYDQGIILAHEIGHWLGLHHTFHVAARDSDDPCGAGNQNDSVEDTPAHVGASASLYDSNCARLDAPLDFRLPDTCPDLPGMDPVYNFMNYVKNERCYEGKGELTCGQISRMQQHWYLYRIDGESCSFGEIDLRVVITGGSPGIEYSVSEVLDLGETIWNSTTDFFGNDNADIDVDFCVPYGRYTFDIRELDGRFTGEVEIWVDDQIRGILSEGGPKQFFILPPATPMPSQDPVSLSSPPTLLPTHMPSVAREEVAPPDTQPTVTSGCAQIFCASYMMLLMVFAMR